MSGIGGIYRRDGAPAGCEFVAEMAAAMEFRGPEAQHVWTEGPVALAHTLLKTTYEAEHEQQPASLDGQVWITADARIDARENLVRELGLPQSTVNRPDCELILHAYARWGEACIEHLLGDFAFAIWDSRERKLFCARDHFGIKPFFYSDTPKGFLFSNTLNCIRLHRAVSDELNELAIADFLLFDYNQDLSTTTFQDIRRLPPAHILTATPGAISILRYWSLPGDDVRIRYRHNREYVEHFKSLLEVATADRLRTRRVGVSMSGGLDSTSVAAFVRKTSPQTELLAHTVVFDSLIPDDEGHFAGLVADSLGIPVEFISADHVCPFAPVPEFSIPEPSHEPNRKFFIEYMRRVQSDTLVVLGGNGADPLLSVSPLMNWKSVGAIPAVDTVFNLVRYSKQFRSIPRLRLRSSFLHLIGQSSPHHLEIPQWLAPTIVSGGDIIERASLFSASERNNELRPLARNNLRSAFWPWRFEAADTAYSGTMIEWRHPYFDVRLVRYLLAIPELPYSMDKYLLRLVLKGLIPESVRTRPKTPLRVDPVHAGFKKHGLGVGQPIRPHPRLFSYVNPDAVPMLTPSTAADRFWIDSKPISLNNWFISQEEKTCKSKKKMVA